jgi:hypothetical protein
MNCKNCNSPIPSTRVNLGFKVCVQCSDVETYGCVNIINHKTGNTVQPLPKAQAAAINKLGDRKRFGTVLKGGSKSSTYNPGKDIKVGASSSFIGTLETFNQVGEQAMKLLESKGIDIAVQYIDKEVRNYSINPNQAFKIKRILTCIPTL